MRIVTLSMNATIMLRSIFRRDILRLFFVDRHTEAKVTSCMLMNCLHKISLETLWYSIHQIHKALVILMIKVASTFEIGVRKVLMHYTLSTMPLKY